MLKSLERRVPLRSKGLCEYGRLPQAMDRSPFPIDHLIARQHGGKTRADHLAVACLRGHLHKGPNIAGIDTVSKPIAPLDHPTRAATPGPSPSGGGGSLDRPDTQREGNDPCALDQPSGYRGHPEGSPSFAEGIFPPKSSGKAGIARHPRPKMAGNARPTCYAGSIRRMA